MFIEEIEIQNIMGCSAIHLSFEDTRTPIYVVQSATECPLRHLFCKAVQLLFSSKYANEEALSEFTDIRGNGKIRITFLLPKAECEVNGAFQICPPNDEDSDSDMPCTSQQAKERLLRRRCRRDRLMKESKKASFTKVTAKRDFHQNADQIEYAIDVGPLQQCSVEEFQRKFSTNIDYELGRLKENYEKLKGNWLSIFLFEQSLIWSKSVEVGEVFKHFVNLYVKNKYDQFNFLSRLTKSCLMSNIALNVIQKTVLLKIFRDTRSIFEFVTCMEYTVWFLIPYTGRYVDINELTTDNLDFNNLKTCIRLKLDTSSKVYLWDDAEHVIQDLLLIAFQLALAFHCKRCLIYVQELDSLKIYQGMQMANAGYLQRLGCTYINWTNKNYLQRIIDVCFKIGVTVIIGFSGGLPLPPVNANVIKCFKDNSSGWSMKVEQRKIPITVDHFINCIDKNLEKH